MKQRDSNIGLLRVIATFSILVLHCNGWFLQLNDITTWSAGKDIFVGITRATIQSITCIGVNIFVLISGFFSIKPKLNSILNLFFILVFFYVGTYFADIFLCDISFSWKQLMINICAFSHENWFIQCYLFLILLSPILNAFVEKCSNRYLLTYLIVYQLFSFYFCNIHNSTYFYFNQGYSITTFVLLYLVGRYLKIFGLNYFEKIDRRKIVLIYALSVLVIILVRFLSNNEQRWLSYNSPFLVFSSIMCFIIFTKIQIKCDFINKLEKSCLSVYIFHTKTPIITYFIKYNVYVFTQYNFSVYIILMLMGCLIVFVSAVSLDKLRMLITNPLLKVIDKKIRKEYE